MKPMVYISIILLGIIAIVGYFVVQYFISRPMYEPGMIRANSELNLNPPVQIASQNFWIMEKDIKLYHFESGTGENVLVIHGGPGFPFTKPLPGLEKLTDSYRFLYYHQRGCGKSSRPINHFSSADFNDNVKTLEKTLGLTAQLADIERIRRIIGDEKLIIIGHSFGAFMASLYAAEFPEKIKAMILVSPADLLLFPQEREGLYDLIKKRLPKEMLPEYEDYLNRFFDFGNIFKRSEDDLKALNAEILKYYSVAAGIDNLGQSAQRTLNNGGWMAQAMYFSMGMKHDYRAALKNINAPVLVIHSEDDLQSKAVSESFTYILPNATLVTIKNAKHFSFVNKPDAFSKELRSFLNTILNTMNMKGQKNN